MKEWRIVIGEAPVSEWEWGEPPHIPSLVPSARIEEREVGGYVTVSRSTLLDLFNFYVRNKRVSTDDPSSREVLEVLNIRKNYE